MVSGGLQSTSCGFPKEVQNKLLFRLFLPFRCHRQGGGLVRKHEALPEMSLCLATQRLKSLLCSCLLGTTMEPRQQCLTVQRLLYMPFLEARHAPQPCHRYWNLIFSLAFLYDTRATMVSNADAVPVMKGYRITISLVNCRLVIAIIHHTTPTWLEGCKR